jgi:hypothetical protein
MKVFTIKIIDDNGLNLMANAEHCEISVTVPESPTHEQLLAAFDAFIALLGVTK